MRKKHSFIDISDTDAVRKSSIKLPHALFLSLYVFPVELRIDWIVKTVFLRDQEALVEWSNSFLTLFIELGALPFVMMKLLLESDFAEIGATDNSVPV